MTAKLKTARSKMPREERAKQFAPFSPLNGLQQALRQKEIERFKKDSASSIDQEQVMLQDFEMDIYDLCDFDDIDVCN